jgi:hypothetical protein
MFPNNNPLFIGKLLRTNRTAYRAAMVIGCAFLMEQTNTFLHSACAGQGQATIGSPYCPVLDWCGHLRAGGTAFSTGQSKDT